MTKDTEKKLEFPKDWKEQIRWKRPLTDEDIAEMNETMDELIGGLFKGRALKRELKMPLTHKINGYIGIADSLVGNPNFNIGPELGDAMRYILEIVEEYYEKNLDKL